MNVSGSVQFVLDIYDVNLRRAKNEWARLTGHNDDLWNKRKQTYFEWPIVETTEPALQRKKSTDNPFLY